MAKAIPLSSTTGGLTLSQANLTSLGAPPAFKVELIPVPGIPIDSEEIYRAATDMMYIITERPLMQMWFDQGYPSPVGDSGIWIRHASSAKIPSRLSTQHIIWGLNHILLAMTVRDRYCQTTALLRWEGAFLGSIHVARKPPEGREWSRQNPSILNTTGLALPSSLAFTEFEISVRFGEKPIPKKIIYLTTIKAMGEACERGLSTPVPGMLTNGLQQVTWKLVPESLGNMPKIEAGYSRIAVIKTLIVMVKEQTFLEAIIWAEVDGELAAFGGFTHGKGSSLLSRSPE
ncbi:MAG: hypothetical protein L6R40_004619 [Gallowayella cf. fulva]|nr:MAG: hypothetical protein L6R40_004619 [Xanthomendoza cf. fulva]